MSLKDVFDLRTIEPIFSKSSEEVQREMDDWAASFDVDTVRICYRAPTDVAHLARKTWEALQESSSNPFPFPGSWPCPPGDRPLKVYDLGCGTGLAGRYFLHLRAIVDGCDLSEKMLRQARVRGYRDLQQVDLSQETPTWQEQYDIALCAGVIGDYLTPRAVIPKMAAMIQPQGVICFSAESKRITLENLFKVLSSCDLKPTHVGQGLGYKGHMSQIMYHYVAAVRR